MSKIGSILKDKSPLEQAQWWLDYALAQEFDDTVIDGEGMFCSQNARSVSDAIIDLINAKLATFNEAKGQDHQGTTP